MKKVYIFLFVLTLFCVTSITISAATIYSIGSIPGTVSNAGVATGGGLWSATTTWAGGVVPVDGDSVVIVNGDMVNINAAANALSITVKTGGTVCQGAGVTNSATGTGTFTLEAGSWWYAAYGSATKMPQGFGTYTINPASNWVFTTAASSSLINALPSAGPVIYGNVTVYKTGSVLAAATTITNINIQGNLIVNVSGSTLKSCNNKSSVSTTIHVGGNVQIIAGAWTGVDAVVQTTSCVCNIDGNVTVGDASTASGVAALAPVSAADAGYLRTGTFNINGNLSYINGAKLEAGTNATSTNVLESAVINLKGNLSTDGTVTTSSNTVGTFKINFIGTIPQTIFLGVPIVFSYPTIFTINNASGVSLVGPAELNNNTALNLLLGNINTGSTNLLTISGSGSITGGSSSSFISGPLAFNNTDASLKSFVYPIGKGAIYRPVTISVTQSAVTLSTYTAEMFNASPTSNAVPGTLDKVSSVRYYNVIAGTGGSAFTAGSISLNYNTDDGVSDYTNLRIAKDDGAGNWVDLGGTGTANTNGTISSTIPFTSFGKFVLANNKGGLNTLPVELSSFTTAKDGRNIKIDWSTNTEINCFRFEVERSLINNNAEALPWVSAGIVKASGTNNSPKNYSFTDKNLRSGKYQYRLKIVDFNGSYNFSNIEETEIAIPKNFELSQNYPNPFNPSTSINYSISSDSKVILEVYSLKGARVSQLVNEAQPAGYYTVNFNSSQINNNISSGVYFYRIIVLDKITRNTITEVKKMMLLK